MKKTIFAALLCLSLVGCVQNYGTARGPEVPNYNQALVLERSWNNYYNGCLRDTLRNRELYVSHGIDTEDEKEQYCACFANGIIDPLMQDLTPMRDGSIGYLQENSKQTCFTTYNK